MLEQLATKEQEQCGTQQADEHGPAVLLDETKRLRGELAAAQKELVAARDDCQLAVDKLAGAKQELEQVKQRLEQSTADLQQVRKQLASRNKELSELRRQDSHVSSYSSSDRGQGRGRWQPAGGTDRRRPQFQ